MDLGLKGKTAVVTGGSKGIGYAVAKTFLEEGANVFICARNAEEVDAAVRSLSRATAPSGTAVSDGMAMPAATSAHTVYGAVYGTAADMTVEEDVYRAAKEAYDRFGSLDCWINNVGASFPRKGKSTGNRTLRKSQRYVSSVQYTAPRQHSAI